MSECVYRARCRAGVPSRGHPTPACPPTYLARLPAYRPKAQSPNPSERARAPAWPHPEEEATPGMTVAACGSTRGTLMPLPWFLR